MDEIKKTIGVSLLFTSTSEIGSINGIIRSYTIPQPENVSDLLSTIEKLVSNYPNNEKYIGIENIFHITQFMDENLNSIYGKSYIEPINKKEVVSLISKRTILKEINTFNVSDELLISLLYYSKLSKLAISCLTNCLVTLTKDYLAFNKNSTIHLFDSKEFKSRFINKDFDGVSPEDFICMGIERIYTFSNEVVNNSLNFMCLTNNSITVKELKELIIDEVDMETSLNECEEWLECIEAISR